MTNGYPRNLPGLMTEAQAQTHKTCPLTLLREKSNKCLGSRCAVWVWELWPRNSGPSPHEPVGRCGLIASGMPVPFSGKGDVCQIKEEPGLLDFD